MPSESTPDAIKTPIIPDELWAIVLSDDPGSFVPPIDDPGVEVFMVCRSKEDAEKLAEHQLAWLEEKPIPVRVK